MYFKWPNFLRMLLRISSEPAPQNNLQPISTISHRVSGSRHSRNNQVNPRLAWQDLTNVPNNYPCYHPGMAFFECVVKYLKVNLFNLLIMSINLPQIFSIYYIKYWNLQCDDEWKTQFEICALFSYISFFLYPHFVKIKLNKFS